MKKNLSIINSYVFIFVLIAFFSINNRVYAQFSSPTPNNSSQPSVLVSPLPSFSSTPVPTSPATPVPTPLPQTTPEPTSTPVPTPVPTPTPQPVSSVINDNSSSGGINSPLFEEDYSDDIVIIPLIEVFDQVRDEITPVPEEENQNAEVQSQTPGEIISPIIPREVLERIVPSGLYKVDGLNPIDGLILLIFGVGFIISGISLLRSDIFLPALADFTSSFRFPLKKKIASSVE